VHVHKEKIQISNTPGQTKVYRYNSFVVSLTEVFCHIFEENYPFFKLHNVDWDGIYKTYRPKVTARTTDDELFEIFSEVIKASNDPHVSLRAGGK
jgi:hypothetical protein